MALVYTLDVTNSAPSGGVPLQDLGIRGNVPKWSNPPTNTILTTNYNLTDLGIKHEEIQVSEMLTLAITSGYVVLYGDGIEIPDNNTSLIFSGNVTQYIRGDGSLGNFPTTFGNGGGGVSYYLNGGNASDVATYYEMSKIADLVPNSDFSQAGNGLISQFLTPPNEPNIVLIPGGNWNCGVYISMSANGGTPAIYLELLKYDGSNFTSIATSTNEVITGGVNIDLYTLTIPVPQTPLTPSDRLAIRVYAANSAGKTTTLHTQDSHLCEISTTFSTGVSSINGLTSPTQYFTTGTSGTNFGISSSGETHTFNLPIASAVNTGKLSSTDWSTFNSKGNGSVTSVSVVSANGLAGTVANNTTTPAITLTTSITGVLKGNGTAISAASAGTDYVAPNAAITGSTNTKITYDSKGLVTAGAAAVLASADFANQGTTTTVLHGNAAGNPSFSAVSLTADVSGILPIANGGTNSGATLNNNRIMVSSGGAIVEASALTNGQILIGSTGLAPVPSTLTQGAGVTITNAAGSVTIKKTILDNYLAIVKPTVTDDSNAGYSVGSSWINTVTKKAYVCLDAAVGAAVWGADTRAGGGDLSPVFTASFAADNKNYIASPSMNSNGTWFTIAQILFPGTTRFGTITDVYMNAWRTAGTAPYDLRLFDPVSALSICNSGSRNDTLSSTIVTMTSLSNIPTAPTVLLIQCQRLAANNTTLGFASIMLSG